MGEPTTFLLGVFVSLTIITLIIILQLNSNTHTILLTIVGYYHFSLAVFKRFIC